MKFWVKKWKAKEIIKMRRDVLEMVQGGARIETIKNILLKEVERLSENKADFFSFE